MLLVLDPDLHSNTNPDTEALNKCESMQIRKQNIARSQLRYKDSNSEPASSRNRSKEEEEIRRRNSGSVADP
jgi:hypothetical protein